MSRTRPLILLALASGCVAGDPKPPPVVTTDTAQQPPSPETTEPGPVAPRVLSAISSIEGPVESYLGTSLSVVGGSLVIGAPSTGSSSASDLARTSETLLVRPPFELGGYLSGAPPHTTLVGSWAVDTTKNTQLGAEVVSPGDLTGDGLADLVSFDGEATVAFEAQAFLYPGPLDDRGTWYTIADPAEPQAIPLLGAGGSRNGTACGDVDQDGRDDLCVQAGVLLGPVDATTTPTITWSAAGPVDQVRLVHSDLDGDGRTELLIWDATARAVRWLRDFAPGDVDLETLATWTTSAAGAGESLATGDLDGDGAQDFALAWTDGVTPRVFVVTDTAGGPLEVAHAQLTLPPAKPITGDVPFCWRSTGCSRVTVVVGDVDDDGADDLVVGWDSEVRWCRGPLPAGELALDAVAGWWRGAVDHDGLGHAILVSDVNADGRTDLVLGAPDEIAQVWYPNPNGRVYVLDGPGL